MSKQIKSLKLGFTLIELLVVMAILGILATVGFGQYRTSQKKARDGQRKADLGNIARAMEMYCNDNQNYPLSEDDNGGRILIDDVALNWGEDSFSIIQGDQEVVYMKRLSEDPANDFDYCYLSTGSDFKIYAKLENERDFEYKGPYTCNEDDSFTYGISSSNTTP